jgi:hypothetical protein
VAIAQGLQTRTLASREEGGYFKTPGRADYCAGGPLPRRCGAGAGTSHPMASQRPEDVAVDRLEHLPVEKSGKPSWPERADLDQLILVAVIAEPTLSEEPSDGSQYQHSWFAPRNDPPVDRLALGQRRRASKGPSFPDEPTEHRSQPPGKPEAARSSRTGTPPLASAAPTSCRLDRCSEAGSSPRPPR